MTLTGQPVRSLLLIGPTGSGKTPLGRHIEKRGINGVRCFHFDFGHELRAAALLDTPGAVFTEAEFGVIRSVIDQGALLEDGQFSIARKIVSRFIDRARFSGDNLLVLNGLPRHTGQARDISPVASVIGLIVLDCEAGDVCRRIELNTGGDRAGRNDDDIEMVRRKLDIFRERTEPLISYYRGQGVRICRIRVTAGSSTEDAYGEVLKSSLFS